MPSSSSIVPRWEWRAFGQRFPGVDSRLDAERAELKRSVETYIIGAADDVNVKIRDGRIDVKRRLRTDHGLELWSPVMKAAFPIDAGTVSALYGQWGLTAPALSRDRYTSEEFLEDVIGPSGLRVAEVRKARRQTSIADCAVELASLDVDGRTLLTAAVESEHPDEVHHLARALGLSGHENVSYVAALRRMLHVDVDPARTRAREGATP